MISGLAGCVTKGALPAKLINRCRKLRQRAEEPRTWQAGFLRFV
jgi:hypothetical protein